MKNLKVLSLLVCFMLIGQFGLRAQDKVDVSPKDILGKYKIDGKEFLAEIEKKVGFLPDEQREGILNNVKNQYLHVKANNQLEVGQPDGSSKNGTWKLEKGKFVTKVTSEKHMPIIAFEKGKRLVLDMPNSQLGSIKITWKLQ